MHSPSSQPGDPGLAARLIAVRQALQDAASAAHRPVEAVAILAVSKTRPAEAVAALHALGITHFGENYLQEALPKVAALQHLEPRICWHFIGALQSNKTREVAAAFDWVHTVDRARIGQRLHAARPAERGPLNVCLQVNLHAEPQKAGVAPNGLRDLIEALRPFDALRLRGLMALPARGADPRAAFECLAELFNEHREMAGPHWDTLSMGMSADFADAVAAGSTLIRIGTGLFGPRPDKPPPAPHNAVPDRERP